jgi:hypothetical protein
MGCFPGWVCGTEAKFLSNQTVLWNLLSDSNFKQNYGLVDAAEFVTDMKEIF